MAGRYRGALRQWWLRFRYVYKAKLEFLPEPGNVATGRAVQTVNVRSYQINARG